MFASCLIMLGVVRLTRITSTGKREKSIALNSEGYLKSVCLLLVPIVTASQFTVNGHVMEFPWKSITICLMARTDGIIGMF